MKKIIHHYACEVAFAETDASGRVHFLQTLLYAEKAEHDFLSRRGIPIFRPDFIGWPRVKVSCDYLLPLHFKEKIKVQLELQRIGTRSLHWAFSIYKEEGAKAALGEVISVKVNGKGEPEEISLKEKQQLEGSL